MQIIKFTRIAAYALGIFVPAPLSYQDGVLVKVCSVNGVRWIQLETEKPLPAEDEGGEHYACHFWCQTTIEKRRKAKPNALR